MNWEDLIQGYRLGCPKNEKGNSEGRTEFQRDFDRLVFSTEFRRLHGKTQVFPFPENDFIHTRMTHSIESVSVGRSLGNIVGKRLFGDIDITPNETGSIVSAACLAHDLGNPPFGHSGEDAIKYFFNNEGKQYLNNLDDEEKEDFLNFESNAMTFHMLTYSNSKKTKSPGGFSLTYPTLAALVKYPRISNIKTIDAKAKSEKKPGILIRDLYNFKEIADTLKIKQKNSVKWHRHPLAFLTEAADDICYTIMDLEDGYNHGLVSYEVVEELLVSVIYLSIEDKKKYSDIMSNLTDIIDDKEKVGYLRAKAIHGLVMKVADSFIEKETEILNGEFDKALFDTINCKDILAEIEDISINKIYSYKSVVEIESAGYKVLPDLLDKFLYAAQNADEKRSKKILELLPNEYRFDYDTCRYQSILSIVKYVIGMTDNFAVDTYRKLNGIELPNY